MHAQCPHTPVCFKYNVPTVNPFPAYDLNVVIECGVGNVVGLRKKIAAQTTITARSDLDFGNMMGRLVRSCCQICKRIHNLTDKQIVEIPTATCILKHSVHRGK